MAFSEILCELGKSRDQAGAAAIAELMNGDQSARVALGGVRSYAATDVTRLGAIVLNYMPRGLPRTDEGVDITPLQRILRGATASEDLDIAAAVASVLNNDQYVRERLNVSGVGVNWGAGDVTRLGMILVAYQIGSSGVAGLKAVAASIEGEQKTG